MLTSGFRAIRDRHLEAAAATDLALWALRGLSALDPLLEAEQRDGVLRLGLSGRDIAQRRAGDRPGEAAAALAWLFDAAWDASPVLRRGGADRMVQAAYDEIFNHLDPYSRYVPADEAEAARERRLGVAGAGIEVEAGPRGSVVVAAVAPNSPAARAGVRAGDRLLAADGRSVSPTRLEPLRALLEGESPGNLRLLLLRGRTRVSAVLRRAVAIAPSVQAERRGDLLLLRIGSFTAGTADQLAGLLRRNLQSGARGRPPQGLVLDLRGNRGGLLREGVAVAATFLDDGPVGRTEGRHPDALRRWESAGPDLAEGRPLVVLVDGRTASSSEIVSAALSDRRRAVVVGSTTMGKGLIQILVPMPNGAELSLSWSRILAPDGWPLQGLGVIPAVCTSLSEEATRRQVARLEQGEAPMAAVLARQRAARAPVLASEVVALRGACPPAEGREADGQVAQALLARPELYRAAIGP
ncbi:PDZ domain-containing protein [Roseomonas sp. OT10]|uniref:S41 family peptidase n=1 Tax=Roseomonas cutis TaxID=2897332 RepID=UPI001E2EBD19|nr:S41 family peptidase [Roseomonas sp. OT10]UFN51041.1 PDZ domain-containing protein [Roseomonas sp. OT10]